MIVYANRDIEIYCDSSVLKQVSPINRKGYALALLAVAANHSTFSMHLFANFSSSAMEERIENIVKRKKISNLVIVVSLVFMAAVTTAFATAPYQNPVTDKPFVVDDIGSSKEDTDGYTQKDTSESSAKLSLSSPLKSEVLGKIYGDLAPESACELSYLTPKGTPVYAPVQGVVAQVQEEIKWPAGRYVIIQCSENLFVSVRHLQDISPTLKAGDLVDDSIQIGTSGATGNASEPMVGISLFSGSGLVDKTQLNLSQWPSELLQQIN